MFKAIKEFFVGKPKPAPEVEVPYKVEVAPVVETPKAEVVVEGNGVVEIVPAGTEATMSAPAKKAPKAKAPAKPKAEKKPAAPKAPKVAKAKAPAKKKTTK